MAASMMLPGLVAGMLQEAMGYPWYFGLVLFCGLGTAVAVLIARRGLPETFGRK